MRLVNTHSDPPVFTGFSWGRIRIFDRLGTRNSFVTFGGSLHAERLGADALLLICRSPAPILRLAGHSQQRDAGVDEVLSFFARLVPRLWSPADERLVNGRTPEELYGAFLVQARHRLERSAELREAMSGDLRLIHSQLAIMAAHRPTGLATGSRLLHELRLAG